jgi:hypothetical protein
MDTIAFRDLQLDFMMEWRRCSDGRRLDIVVGFLRKAHDIGVAEGISQKGRRILEVVGKDRRQP